MNYKKFRYYHNLVTGKKGITPRKLKTPYEFKKCMKCDYFDKKNVDCTYGGICKDLEKGEENNK